MMSLPTALFLPVRETHRVGRFAVRSWNRFVGRPAACAITLAPATGGGEIAASTFGPAVDVCGTCYRTTSVPFVRVAKKFDFSVAIRGTFAAIENTA